MLGDEAARRVNLDDLDGVVVDVEITDWPSPTQNPRGKVVEILGYEDDFGVDVEIMRVVGSPSPFGAPFAYTKSDGPPRKADRTRDCICSRESSLKGLLEEVRFARHNACVE